MRFQLTHTAGCPSYHSQVDVIYKPLSKSPHRHWGLEFNSHALRWQDKMECCLSDVKTQLRQTDKISQIHSFIFSTIIHKIKHWKETLQKACMSYPSDSLSGWHGPSYSLHPDKVRLIPFTPTWSYSLHPDKVRLIPLHPDKVCLIPFTLTWSVLFPSPWQGLSYSPSPWQGPSYSLHPDKSYSLHPDIVHLIPLHPDKVCLIPFTLKRSILFPSPWQVLFPSPWQGLSSYPFHSEVWHVRYTLNVHQ